MKRLIATDFDGTLRRDSVKLEDEMIKINRFRAAGNYFGIVTGRGIDFVKKCEEYHISYDFLIVYNGSLVLDSRLNIIHEDLIFRDDFKSIEEIFSDINDVCYYDKVGNELFYHHYYATMENNKRALEVADLINDKLGDTVIAFVNNEHINIGSVGSGKTEGVKYIADFYGLKYDECAVVGDDCNDLAMIAAFDGWTVETARKEIKSKCNHICSGVGDLALRLIEK